MADRANFTLDGRIVEVRKEIEEGGILEKVMEIC
jgi:hypothetical protein